MDTCRFRAEVRQFVERVLSPVMLGSCVDEALLHLSGGFERGEIRFEESLSGHKCDHFGAEIDDVEVRAIRRCPAGAGDFSSSRFQLNVGLMQALKSD